MDFYQSPVHQRPPPSVPEPGPSKGAPSAASGFDGVYDFLNSVISAGTGTAVTQLPARFGLNGLWPLQPTGSVPLPTGKQPEPPGDTALTSPISPTSPTSSSVGVSVGALAKPLHLPTLQPRCPSIGATPPHAPAGETSDAGIAEEADSHCPEQAPGHDTVPPEREGQDHRLRNSRCRRGDPFEVDQDDPLDQHVAYYLRHHPDIHARHAIRRNRPGVYQVDAREVTLEWQYSSEQGGQGLLVVVDGPLKQPFSDYMEMTENNAEYDSQTVRRSSLSEIPKEKRMSFDDKHKVYTRLEAMKVAKEQAQYREEHADYLKEGKEVPDDLLHKYKQTLNQKLGQQSTQRGQTEMHMVHGVAHMVHGVVPDREFRQPPPPPPPAVRSMHHVYREEPMDVNIFCHFTGGDAVVTARGPEPSQMTYAAYHQPPSAWNGPAMRALSGHPREAGDSPQLSSPLPAPPPPSWARTAPDEASNSDGRDVRCV